MTNDLHSTSSRKEALQYLKPEVLHKIENLELIARLIVEGLIMGLHRSPYHGFSAEFSSYRKYSPGDDIKFLDWRLFARTDRYFIKQFEETTNLNCYLVADTSASMAMAGANGVGKLDYTRYLLAGLTYLMLGQSDAVSLLCANEGKMDFIPPSGRTLQLMTVLSILSATQAENNTNLPAALELLAGRIKGRSMIMVVSDLFLDSKTLMEKLSYFRYRNHEVILFHILNDLEREFPYTNVTTFQDLESGRQIHTEPTNIRKQYLDLLAHHVESILNPCRDMEIDFVPLTTNKDLGSALFSYLARRARVF